MAVRSDDSRKSKASTARQSIDKTPKPSTALVTFIKAKAAQIECTVKELVDGSEQRSSLSSSLRTEKSLQRQKDWEVDHARARARRLRQEMVARFKQEEKIRRQLADGQSRSLVASDSYKDTLDEVMSSVGWSPEETYSQEQLTEFAKKAMSQASTLESSSSAGLARFAASPT